MNKLRHSGRSFKRRGFLLSVALLAVFLLLGAASDEVARLAEAMNWKPGDVIADVGAGDGELAFAAHTYIDPTGKVYATELDPKKLESLKQELARRGWKNFEVLTAAEKETNLPPSCCDGILLRRVYHHLTAPTEMDASLYKSLKPGGVLAIIDFPPRAWLTLSDPVKGVPANRGGHGIPQKILIEELAATGFVVVRIIDSWPNEDYCVLFRKPIPVPATQ
ncbi:MAG TPA: methyltransferase [Candidatus Acidoferrum sp.]|nr:methyltransferase [Candidatus Acidoferrum sp.]